MIITLDGPCGSGKSTLAQLLAKKLGYFYINSGYLYRSLAYILVAEFAYTHEMLQNPNFDHITLILHEDNFSYKYSEGIVTIFFRGIEVTQYLKSTQVSHDASIVAAHLEVRKLIQPLQQKFGVMYNLVTDGRDGGTEIYPHAQFKFYLIAQSEIRAQRLQVDLERKGVEMSFKQALQMTQDRDARDMNRLVSPLKKADDAIEIDSSNRSIDQILQTMLAFIQQK